MSKYRNIRVSEDTWRKLKQMALDEGTTLHAIVERTMAGIGGPSRVVQDRPRLSSGSAFDRVKGDVELRYERED